MSSFDPALAEEAFEDDVEGLSAFLRSVLSRLLENCERVKASAAKGDTVGLRAAAHAAKGSAGHLGGKEVEALASRVELAARDGKVERAEVIAELGRLAGALEETVERYITEREAQRGSS